MVLCYGSLSKLNQCQYKEPLGLDQKLEGCRDSMDHGELTHMVVLISLLFHTWLTSTLEPGSTHGYGKCFCVTFLIIKGQLSEGDSSRSRDVTGDAMYYANFHQGAIFSGGVCDDHATSGDRLILAPSFDYIVPIAPAKQEATTLKGLEEKC